MKLVKRKSTVIYSRMCHSIGNLLGKMGDFPG